MFLNDNPLKCYLFDTALLSDVHFINGHCLFFLVGLGLRLYCDLEQHSFLSLGVPTQSSCLGYGNPTWSTDH